MFYEIDSDGNKIRHLPGYFIGFKDDLAGVDSSLLSDLQKDYLSISDDLIIEVSDEEHLAFQTKKTATERCLLLRKQAYINESDGLFFDYQRGEIEKSAWLSKVAEIKSRYPKP